MAEAAIVGDTRQGMGVCPHHGAGRLHADFHKKGMRRHAQQLGKLAQKLQRRALDHPGQLGNAQRLRKLGRHALQDRAVHRAQGLDAGGGRMALPGHEAQRSLLDGQRVRFGAQQQLAQLVRNLQGAALPGRHNAPCLGCRRSLAEPLFPMRLGAANHQVLAARGRFGKHVDARRRACHRPGPGIEVDAAIAGNGMHALLALQRDAQRMQAGRVMAAVGRAAQQLHLESRWFVICHRCIALYGPCLALRS